MSGPTSVSRQWLGWCPWLVTGGSILLMFVIREDWVPALRGPAPYPPEWQWRYRPLPLAPMVLALAIAASLVALIAASGRPARRASRRWTLLLLIVGPVLGFGFHMALLLGQDGGLVAHLLRRTMDPGINSYFEVAQSERARDLTGFLEAYADLLPTFPGHAATHPPGPILYYRALGRLFAREPWLASRIALVADRGEGEFEELSETAVASALVGALLLQGLAVLTCWPIAVLGRVLGGNGLQSARNAVLWVLLPGPALMVPGLDPAIAFPVAAAAACLALSLDRVSLVRWAAMAGLFAGAAVALSYGAALFLALGATCVTLPALAAGKARVSVVAALGTSALIAAAVFFLPSLWGHDPLRAARTALAVHRDAYTAVRRYVPWLLFGPLDLVMFAGPPVMVAFVAAASRRRPRECAVRLFARAVAVGLALLFASGLVRGEVGRILIPMLPFVLVPALASDEEDRVPAHLLTTALLLAAFCLVLRSSWEVS